MGRKAKTKKQKINEMVEAGYSVKEIVRKTKATPAYVYKIRTHSRDFTPCIEEKPTAKKSWWQRIKEWLC